MELADASLTELLEFVHGVTAMNFAIELKAVEKPGEEMIYLNVRDLPVDNVLKLVLHPRNRTPVAAGEVVLISSPSRVRKTPRGPSWRDPAEARRLELLLDALASRVPGRHRKAADELAEIPCGLRAEYPWKPVFIAKGLRVARFLRAATRPYGLDFRLDGPKVVIESAERVRRVVEK